MNEVEAVKDRATIEKIEHRLENAGQIYADIWSFGLNVGLRISDLVGLRFDDVMGDHVEIVEGKTKKRRSFKINGKARAVVDRRRAANPGHVYLFQSDSNRSRSLCKPIGREIVARVFKRVGEGPSIGVKLSTHSMRKTRGYMMHKKGFSIERICAVLNHSSPAVTMRYIGLTQEDINSSYDEIEI
ncbi:tyrosine-type recombinase/integrase [Kushneria marisflavi]|uniref:tyrosine-type recombinase/integrase n=1 Tax=Kushneria marisflavi TaxID=157779 RepID=UPI000E74E0A4|nr:tyrosine-type recombinase/integrase [Kushneria marisflavi]RKD75788.1 phage integrase family protein [Kushneria marisflavi]